MSGWRVVCLVEVRSFCCTLLKYFHMCDGQRASRASPENGFKFGRVIFAEHVRNASEKLLVCFP